ncbi:MAG: DUF3108 domain-containing protein [Tannerella sp.]|jgi:hypothetical protein|nr:DUF3108 domain-containing protein [Tannerella sp.]
MKIVNIIALLITICLLELSAQNKMFSSSLKSGETVIYDLYFKWGVVMARAGEASFSYSNNYSVLDATSRYRMTFKTTKFFDGIFKMRDTLDCYFNDDYKLMYSRKGSDEGGYYLVDEMRLKHNSDSTKVHSKRYTPTTLKIDTTITATGEVVDMLGAIFLLRGVDRTKLQNGDKFPAMVAVGREFVKMTFIYQNQAIVEHDNVKYNTRYFKIDIYDEAFESTKTSAEVWVGDDDNFLPVKVRSKLKLGYAEVYYKNSTGLANPLTCRIEMK